MVKGKTIEEAMQITNKAVMEALDGLPPVKVHCSLLAEEAIHAAPVSYTHLDVYKRQVQLSCVLEFCQRFTAIRS